LIALASIFAPPTNSVARAQELKRRVDDAVGYFFDYERLWQQESLDEVEVILADMLAGYDEDPRMHFIAARVHEQQGDARSAIDGYRRALAIGFENRDWISYRIARLFAQLSEPDSAIAWLDRALAARYGDRPDLANDEAFADMMDDPHFRRVVGRLPDREFTREEGWRYDIDFLVSEARRMHVAPHRPAFSAEFETAARDLRARVPDLTNDQILVELSRLVTILGDGHTAIYGPSDDSPLTFESGSLPILFYLFNDGLYIVDAVDEHRRWIGAEVLRFGPLSTESVLDELDLYVHHDNPQTYKWLGVHFALRRRVVLYQAMGATDDPNHVTLTLRDRHGSEHEVTFEGGDYEFRRKLRPQRDAPDTPRWLEQIDRNYSLEHRAYLEAVYWQFNRVRDLDDGPSLAEFSDTLRSTLLDTGARYLIVDVRHNNGGNTNLLRPLLRTMTWWEQDGPARRIFVIMGRNTFSATQNFISRVEQWTDAVFVGEPSSSRPNFTGEETDLVLPFSRVRGSISTRYWQNAGPTDERPWIAPQVPITLSSDDYFAGRDPAMAAIAGIISRLNAPAEESDR
jgi:hypothetical protein